MANSCYFVMKVKGKKENVLKFQRIITRNKEGVEIDDETFLQELSKKFHRWVECEVYSQTETEDNEYIIELSGDCAWSINTAMLTPGNDTYTLEELSRDLQLKIEVYSEEYGIAFQEHFFYDNGDCISNECVDAFEYYIENEDELREANEEHGTSYTMDDLDDGYLHIGGFENWKFEI